MDITIRRGRQRIVAAVLAVLLAASGALVASPSAGAAPARSSGTSCPGGSTPNENFVYAVYADVLNRCADSGGLRFWSDLLDRKVLPRVNFALLIILSDESLASVTDDAYEQFLDRDPTSTELAAGIDVIRRTHRIDTLLSSLIGSAEYYDLVDDEGCDYEAEGVDGCFIFSVYHQVLFRAPTEGPFYFWLSSIRSGPDHTSTVASRTQMAASILNSPEMAQWYVAMDYQFLLWRDPDPGGAAFWYDFLLTNHTEIDFVARLIGSAEYFNNAQRVTLVARNAQAKAAVDSPAQVDGPFDRTKG